MSKEHGKNFPHRLSPLRPSLQKACTQKSLKTMVEISLFTYSSYHYPWGEMKATLSYQETQTRQIKTPLLWTQTLAF